MNPDKELRRDKVLDHLVFCGWLDKYKGWQKTNPLSLNPKEKKISDEFEDLEQMIYDSITEIERMKKLKEESGAADISKLHEVQEDPNEDILESKLVDSNI